MRKNKKIAATVLICIAVQWSQLQSMSVGAAYASRTDNASASITTRMAGRLDFRPEAEKTKARIEPNENGVLARENSWAVSSVSFRDTPLAATNGIDDADTHPGTVAATSEGNDARDDVRPSPPSNLNIADTHGDEAFDCQAHMETLSPFGQQIVIGQGNPDGCSEAALKEAVQQLENTQGGGTILFDCGGDQHKIVITSEIEMNNARILIDGNHRITLSGEDKSRVIHTTGQQNHLMVQRISIARGTAVESGAGIFSEWRGALTAIDVTFNDNNCTGMVGEKGGGAIRLRGPGDTIISGCTFIGNTAANGGAIMTTAGNIQIVNTVFKNNQALAERPAGNNDNLAYGNGGALRLDGMNKENRDDFRICGTVFTGNVAKGSGGAINAFFYRLDNTYAATFIDQCVFKDNVGDAVGAYIHMNGQMNMSRTAFVRNSADGTGAMFLATDADTRIENCTFAENRADVWGAVRVRDGFTDFINCTFAANTAGYAPLFDDGDAEHVTLKNCLITNNQSIYDNHARACRVSMIDGGGNLQWPRQRQNGSNDVPCTSNILWDDPNMQPMAEDATSMPYLPISDNSPATNLGKDCPSHDQLGKDRSNPCESGAIEH